LPCGKRSPCGQVQFHLRICSLWTMYISEDSGDLRPLDPTLVILFSCRRRSRPCALWPSQRVLS
jgi:hypothetical protein